MQNAERGLELMVVGPCFQCAHCRVGWCLLHGLRVDPLWGCRDYAEDGNEPRQGRAQPGT